MKERESKVSVIIPVYNAGLYLEELIEDVIYQTYKNLEIIIINDGSIDNSWEIITRYACLDKRIKSKSIPNSGPSKARNTALDMATGEFVRFIDADDRVSRESIRYMINPYCDKEDDIELVISNFKGMPDKGYYTGESIKECKMVGKEFVDFFIEHAKTFYIGVPWNKLYKRCVIEKYNIRFNEDITWCEDFLFNIEYFSRIRNVYIVNRVIPDYIYYERSGSITDQLKERDSEVLTQIDIMREVRAKNYCRMYGKEQKLEREWKYIGLYKRLFEIAKYRTDVIGKRYQRFIQKLQGKETYQYVCERYERTKSIEWKMIKNSIEKNKFLCVFIYFYVIAQLSRPFQFLEVKRNRKNCLY